MSFNAYGVFNFIDIIEFTSSVSCYWTLVLFKF